MNLLKSQRELLYTKSKQAFTDFTRVASLFDQKPKSSDVIVAALYEVLKTPVAALAISLGYTNFKITTEVLADLEKNFVQSSPEPYQLIFLQAISLFLQAQEYLSGTNSNI